MAFGKCNKCNSTARSVLLINGMCYYHYSGGEVSERSIEPKLEKAKLAASKQKTLKVFFDERIANCPKNCENCKNAIVIPEGITKRAAVAHILSKKLFKSVATNENNIVYMCIPCHQTFDFVGKTKASQMPVASIAKERFKLFKDQIEESERKNIPDWLL